MPKSISSSKIGGFALLTAAGTGVLFTLLLNGQNLLLALQGKLTTLHLLNHGPDEMYYLSLIRSGAWNLSAATLPQALLLRLTDWDISTVVFLGDLFYPALAVFFLAIAGMHLMQSRILGSLAALLAAVTLDAYWLRAANPQVPYVLVAAFIAVYFSGAKGIVASAMKGLIIGMLGWVQLLYASLLLLIEGVDHLRRFFLARKERRAVAGSLAVIIGVVALVLAPQIVGLFSESDLSAIDTYHRMGVIPSRYPAAPVFQIKLLLVGALLFVLRKRSTEWKSRIDMLLTIIVATLIGLNQSVIHGVDATFSSYYLNVILLLKWGILPFILLLLLKRFWLTVGLTTIIVLMALCRFGTVFRAEAGSNTLRDQQFVRSGDALVMEWLKAEEATVVAAPVPLANIIPVLSGHHMLFTSYTYNERVEDADIAERFLLHRSLFPGDELIVDEHYRTVFGGYPGMLAARERTACRIWSRILRSEDPCVMEPRSFILHSELLPILDEGKPDVADLLRKYSVGIIVTNRALPAALRSLCVRSEQRATYTFYRCG